MTTEEHSKSKRKPQNVVKNQKLMMKISSTKNVSGNNGFVILLGGALITAAAMGSAFLISRKHRKSTKKVTKKDGNEKFEDESSNKGLHFILPDCSSSCMEQQQPSSNGTDKLCLNDNDSTSLFSTPCLIQDGKPKLDEEKDTLNAIVYDQPKEGKSPSFERLPEELVLSETKISLLPDPDQDLDEVSEARIKVIQGNEKTEVLAHVHPAQTTIISNPAFQMDNKREILVHNDDKGESNGLQHTSVIETDNVEEGPIQEQEKQATGDQETSTCNEHEPLNSAVELMKAADEDKDTDHLQCVYFEEQCADRETQIDQFAKKCDVRMQFSDEEECAKENDQANSYYEVATSENSPCRTYSVVVQNLDASAIRNASINDEHSAEAHEDEDKGHMQIMYSEEQCAIAEIKINQFAKECNIQMQFSDEQVCSHENDPENSRYEEARVYAQNMATFAIRNDSIDDQNSGEVIQVTKETDAMDPAASGEQSLGTEELVEKQSFESDCQGNGLKENEVEESVFVNEEEGKDDDDYDEDIEKDTAAKEVEDTPEGAGNSSCIIWPADSDQGLLLELKEKKVKEGMQIEEDEPCSVESCNLKSTQNDVAITSWQQSYDSKDDSAVNVIERYRTKLMYLDDIAAIARGRRLLLGALLVLLWYFGTLCLKAFFLPV